MKESNIQFQNPIVEKLDFLPGNNLKNDRKITVDHEFKTEISQNDNEKEAKVKLILDLNAREFETQENVFKLYLEIASLFRWDENLSETEVTQLLKVNGTALLLSYARPIVSYVVSLSGLDPYHIPFLNLTEID